VRLTPMRYKDYIWPSNPGSYRISFRRVVAEHKLPFGRSVTQDLGQVCRVLEGEFIDWRRVVPSNNETILTANVATLTAAIERVSLIVSEKIKSPVRCVFSDNVADFRTVNTIGSAHDTCPVAGNGGELEIGFNCRYLLDALRAIPSEETTLELQNGLSPIVFTPVDEKQDYAYMVLPVRLH